ncbi:MAG: hypothetical protein HPY66_3189 [Firmicutes bacterium]|nr:hypothetical protein [Bacillota bacterium]MDI6706636.1 DUF2905 domain-containing protein [Bacillota bacterium]
MGFESIGRTIIMIGVFLIVLGVGISFFGKIGLGKLPGDILIKRGNFTFYFPLVTGIVISLVLSIIANLFLRR